MKNLTAEKKQQSIEAFHSIIRKSEKALAHLKADAPQTKLLEKRLNAARIGLNTLLAQWEGQEFDVGRTDLIEAKKGLEDLLSTLPSYFEKAKEGSGQRTYISRRIEAFHVAIYYINDWIENFEQA